MSRIHHSLLWLERCGAKCRESLFGLGSLGTRGWGPTKPPSPNAIYVLILTLPGSLHLATGRGYQTC